MPGEWIELFSEESVYKPLYKIPTKEEWLEIIQNAAPEQRLSLAFTALFLGVRNDEQP